MVTLTILTRFRHRCSFATLLLCSGLFRYLAPTLQEMKQQTPLYLTGKVKKRRFDRDRDETNFNLPKKCGIELTLVDIHSDDVQSLPLYPIFSWIVDFTICSVFIYSSSEIYSYFYPFSTAINVSAIWIFLALGFAFHGLSKLTSQFFLSEDLEAERSLVLCISIIYFLLTMILTMFIDRYFDVGFGYAFESFMQSTSAFFSAMKLSEDLAQRSPLLLFLSFSVMFGIVAGFLTFPNFRYAQMYTDALSSANPIQKLFLHITFLSQGFSFLLFFHPVTNYILNGPRISLSKDQLITLRMYAIISSFLLRLMFRRVHLQSHLNRAAVVLAELKKEAGVISSTELQRMIFRYFCYYAVAALQYFIPVLIPFLICLLWKTLGHNSWIGVKDSEVFVSAISGDSSEARNLVSLGVLFNKTVSRGLFSLFLVLILFINFTLSLLGVVYHSFLHKT
ncbi:hypothetical protein AB6A40_006256 [Gnathostoma spinigerum]|uniref:Transmembrane protein 161B n=1 Tax=Gnathostoma spinigerum TaxID=75299 RepID=A0ABD6ES85_9BILA